MGEHVLRDHAEPCDHGEFYRFKVGYPELWCCRVADCPGGREVPIDYEAAAAAMEVWADQLEDKAGRWSATVEAVDAALGDGDG